MQGPARQATRPGANARPSLGRARGSVARQTILRLRARTQLQGQRCRAQQARQRPAPVKHRREAPVQHATAAPVRLLLEPEGCGHVGRNARQATWGLEGDMCCGYAGSPADIFRELLELDPLRRGYYSDELAQRAKVVFSPLPER
jgi:hypothetical protein